MPIFAALRAARAAQRRSLWLSALMSLLTAVLLLQGLGVGMASARGPGHVHRGAFAQAAAAPASRALLLVDVRRGAAPSARQVRPLTWFVHHHGDEQRHHHAAGDASVVFTDAAADAAMHDDSLALDLAVAAFLALLVSMALWQPATGRQRHTALARWWPSSGASRRLERPPQAA